MIEILLMCYCYYTDVSKGHIYNVLSIDAINSSICLDK